MDNSYQDFTYVGGEQSMVVPDIWTGRLKFFGKNQDMTVLIEKEDFYAGNKTADTTDHCR